MPKIIKNKFIYFSETEFNSIAKDQQGRFVFQFQPKEVTEELVQPIIVALKDGKTRSYICEEYGILESDLNKWFKKEYGTHKITEVKAKILVK